MGILDKLFGGRFTMPPPEETNLSASAIMKELRSEAITELAERVGIHVSLENF